MATYPQIKIIHALKGRLGLDDATYRALLEGYGVESSKLLSVERARDLIDRLTAQAVATGVWDDGHTQSVPREHGYGKRYATPRQVAKIEAMWKDVSRATNYDDRKKALRSFIDNHFHIARIEWLPFEVVPKIIRTLESMRSSKYDRNPECG